MPSAWCYNPAERFLLLLYLFVYIFVCCIYRLPNMDIATRRSGRRMPSAWYLFVAFVCLFVCFILLFVSCHSAIYRLPNTEFAYHFTRGSGRRMPSAWCHNPAERWIIPACNIHQHQANALRWVIL